MRGAIHHLAAEDHYTRITTTRGSSLVLLRSF
jgi:DNA-binding LytR/AlgR family response regulator